ncbi:MAG: regulatory protein RecX [Caldilineae bacterium]|nr:MAG: regulatory protein RecX [Caldilineae bacterium]
MDCAVVLATAFLHWEGKQKNTMAGRITALRRQRRDRERVNVFIEGAYAFALPAIEAAKLHVGQHLTDRDVQALQTLDVRARAYDRAVRLLARRPRSAWEVRRALSQPNPKREPLPEEHVEWVIQKLTDQGYLDDADFAAYWMEQRNRFKPLAPRALRYELRSKGVPEAIIDQVLAQQEDPIHLALRAARPRLQRWRRLDEEAFRRKVGHFLQRRGFDWETIREATLQMWREVQAED